MRTAAWEAAPQVALRDRSKEAVGGSQYIRFWWRGEFNTIKHSFYKRFSASPASLVAQLVKNPPAVHEWSCLVVSDFATPWPVACQAPPSMGFFQARALEWVAMAFSRGSSWARDGTQVSCIVGKHFTAWAIREEAEFNPWVGKIPWRRETQSTILAWKIHGLQSSGSQRVGYN